MKRLFTSLALLVAALSAYAAGLDRGAVALVALGSVLEAGFWIHALRLGRRQAGTATRAAAPRPHAS